MGGQQLECFDAQYDGLAEAECLDAQLNAHPHPHMYTYAQVQHRRIPRPGKDRPGRAHRHSQRQFGSRPRRLLPSNLLPGALLVQGALPQVLRTGILPQARAGRPPLPPVPRAVAADFDVLRPERARGQEGPQEGAEHRGGHGRGPASVQRRDQRAEARGGRNGARGGVVSVDCGWGEFGKSFCISVHLVKLGDWWID